LLVWTGMATQQGLREKRPYVIVGAFVLGMILTPPDVISQTLLAVPVWLLFELGIYFSGWFVNQKQQADENTNTAEDYTPLSEAEMDAELDRIDAEEKD
jgi:sec-independent protein translocase protein TatC